MYYHAVRKVSLIIIAVISSLIVWASGLIPNDILNRDVAILIVGQMFSAHLLIYFSKIHWARVYLAVGIPFGLIVASIALVAVFQNLNPDFSVSLVIAYTSILYGGIISAIGYFCIDSNEQVRAITSLKNHHLLISLVPMMIFQALGMEWAAGMGAFLLPELILLFFALAVTSLAVKGKFTPKFLGELALTFSIACLVICLVFVSSDNREMVSGLIIALPGLLYGLQIYVVSYFSSFHSKLITSPSINMELSNWHWIELTAFMLFMCFAPVTLRESLLNDEDDRVAAAFETKLEERLAVYEERLAELEHEPGS